MEWKYKVAFIIYLLIYGGTCKEQVYRNDTWPMSRLPTIAAVAFVPPHVVINAFDEIADLIRNECQVVAGDVLEYFENSYVGRFRRNAPR